MRPWFKLSTLIGSNAKLGLMLDPQHQLMWIGVLSIYWRQPNRGLIPAKDLAPFAVKMALPAFTVAMSLEQVEASLDKLREVKLIADEGTDMVRLTGYDADWWPACTRCHRPNPDDRFSKCPDCRDAATANGRDDPAATQQSPGSARAAPGQRRGAARGEERRRDESTLPPSPSPPAGSAEAAPEASPEGGREVGPADGQSPEGEGDAVAELEDVLLSCGWHRKQGAAARRKEVAQLLADGFTVEVWAELWTRAQAQGRDPAALLATWLNRGTWRDELADAGLAAKEAVLRARTGAVSAEEIGTVYGEPQAVGDVAKNVLGRIRKSPA